MWLCSGWFGRPILPTTPCSWPRLHPFSALCCVLIMVLFLTCASHQAAAAWGPAGGAQKDSVRRKEAAASAQPTRGQAPPSGSLPTSTSRVKAKATWTRACVTHRRNAMKSVPGKTEEGKINFYLIFIRRKEDRTFSCVETEGQHFC